MKRIFLPAFLFLAILWLTPFHLLAQDPATEETEETDVNFDFDPAKFKMGNKSGKRTNIEGYFGVGPTFVSSTKSVSSVLTPDFKPWSSWSTDLGVMLRTRLGGPNSGFNINYGLLWRYLNIETDKAYLDWDPMTKIPNYTDANNTDWTNTELNVHTLSIPLMLEFQKKVAIAAGGFVAFRVSSNSELDQELPSGDTESALIADLGLNDVLYGVTGQIGYKKARIFVNYYLNNLFKEDLPYEFTVFNVGIAVF